MPIRERFVGSIVVIQLEGKLRGSSATSALQDAVRRHADAGCRLLVVDLGDVPDVGADGLAALIHSGRSIKASGGRFCLSRLTKRIDDPKVMGALLKEFDALELAKDAADRGTDETPVFPSIRAIRSVSI